MNSRRNFLRGFLSLGAIEALSGSVHPLLGENLNLRWPNRPPSSCPFDQSDDITGITFTERHREYENADTWYPSWAPDDRLYSPFTDGEVEGIESYSAGSWEVPQGSLLDIFHGKIPHHPVTGAARISGSDPLNLTIEALGTYPGSGVPYAERYPSASLVHDGVWYYGTYAYLKTGIGPQYEAVGPFIGFRISRDYGKTWTDTSLSGSHNLFNESSLNHHRVRMGIPHFVDFGKNMMNSPDGYAYLVGHGAGPESAAEPIWIRGDDVYLARVKPDPQTINQGSKWEFYAGRNEQGKAVWTNHLRESRPIVHWPEHTGPVCITYFAPIRKYILSMSCGWPAGDFTFDTYLLESDQITGPWKLITYMKDFGPRGYFPNFPSKFIGENGLTAWLSFSNDTTSGHLLANPPGARYSLCLHEVKLERK